jgi:hypothetical protein
MKQRPGVRKAPDKSRHCAAPPPPIGKHDVVTLSLALDEWAPPAEAEDRILDRIRLAVNFKNAAEPLE